MKDALRLLRYVRPYLGRLLGAIASSGLLSFTYLALLGLIQPIVDYIFARGAASPAATAGKVQLFDATRRLFGGAHLPAWLADWTARFQGVSTGAAILIAALVVVLFALKGVFTYLSAYLTRWTGLQVVRDLRAHLYARIQGQSLAFFSEYPTGVLIARVVNDVGRIQRAVAGDLAEVFRLGAIVIGQAAWLFYLNWRLASICLILVPLIIYPVARLGRRLKAATRRSQERMGEIVATMKEGIAGIRVVQGFGMEEFETAKFRQALDKMQTAEKRAARVVSLTPAVMEFVGSIGAAGLILYAAQRIDAGKLSGGELATFVAALFMIYASMRNLVKIYNELQQAMVAARRVFDVIDLERRIHEMPGAEDLPPFRRAIEFKGVSFAYGKAPVLRGLDLVVPAGQVVALVGSSGAGKSTLVNLLPRFYDPTAGALLVDGRDIRTVTVSSLRRQIGLVTQEVILFDDTVRHNIAYGRSDVPFERVVAAARAAHAEAFIQALPKGYDTPLGEAGHRLSLGQRQRLSIARAILKDSPILILDEATSSLDSESEAEVQGALQNLMTGRTVFVIAHRLSTVRRADVILVLDQGRIVERGTHADLVARNGVYARLHALQFHGAGAAPQASVS